MPTKCDRPSAQPTSGKNSSKRNLFRIFTWSFRKYYIMYSCLCTLVKGYSPFLPLKTAKTAPPNPPLANQARPRRRAVGTRAQGLFAHATTPGAATIAVTQAQVVRYKNICASEPENGCTLLAAPPTKSECWYPSPRLPSQITGVRLLKPQRRQQ